MKPTNKEVYEQLMNQAFIHELIKKYERIYPFTKDKIQIEVWDEFGQCSVWLGFEDQFAIRDAFGKWRQATASECIELREGVLSGSMKLMD